ncbi:unannotated protein [freshwater metagenome]|uniref:Unannotated protein n=1 Tax=freshwater metagenome TaxID=449393 RepID=A0A6J7GFG1_9ZZZZ
MFEKLSQPTQTHTTARIAQHLTTNRGVGGMNTDIQRREAFGNHPLEIGFGEPRQRREIAIEKTQAVIIIFEIQTLTHPRRQLVDKTKSAVVVTSTNSIKQGTCNFGSQSFASIFYDSCLHLKTAAHKIDLNLGFVCHETPLNDVARNHSVQTNHLITRLQSRLKRRRIWRDCDHNWRRLLDGHISQAICVI